MKNSGALWMIVSTMMSLCPVRSFFPSLARCINIVPQISLRVTCLESLSVPQLSWHVKILSYAVAFAVDRQFSSALPPLLVNGLNYKYTGDSRLFPLSLKQQEWKLWRQFWVNSLIIESKESRISHMWSSCLRNLETALTWGRNTPPGTWLMAERRPDFLKGPLLVSLQNSRAYGFVSMQFTAPDFPAISKKKPYTVALGESQPI